MTPRLADGERWVSCSRETNPSVAAHRHVLTGNGVDTACSATGLGPGVWRGNTRKPPCPECVKRRTPQRVQRTRGKGGGTPPGALYVGRPGPWGNPFRAERTPGWPKWAGVAPWRVVDPDGRVWPMRDDRKPVVFGVAPDYIDGNAWHKARAVAHAVNLYVLHTGPMGNYELDPDDVIAALAGRDLACWCPVGTPCHADHLLTLANPT